MISAAKFHIICILSVITGVISNSSKVTLQVFYPNKLPSLFLRGSSCGLNWDKGVEMSIVESNTNKYAWSIDISCPQSLNTSFLEVKVLIEDKLWMLGANHHISSSLFSSTENSIDSLYPWFYTYTGSLTIIENVYSSELNNFRDVIFYLPPSYYENTLKNYKNILIMHDGQNLFNPLTSAFGTAWMCQDTMNDMIISGSSDEVIIAGAYNTADRIDEYTYIYDPSEGAGGKGDLYLDWIESTLIPLIPKNFRTTIVRDTLGILGSSLGGLISCYGGWTRSTVYGKVGCMSSSFWWDDQDYGKNLIQNQLPSSTVPLPILYMDSGTGSTGELQCAHYTTEIYDYCLTVGFQGNSNVFEYIDQGGTHDEASWGARFYVPVQDLYPSTTV